MTPEQWIDGILDIHPDLFSQPEFVSLSRDKIIEWINRCNVPEAAISKNMLILISEFGSVSFIDRNTHIEYQKHNVTIQQPPDFFQGHRHIPV